MLRIGPRVLVLWLALLGSSDVVFAQDVPAAPAAEAPAATAPEAIAPPATVLEDRLDVVIDSKGQAKEKRTWKVRIDDPRRCTAGLIAPDGLDGARDGVAQVFERLLVPPDATAPGTVFTLVSTRTRAFGPFSGVFFTAPDLPVVSASVSVTSASANLAVWSDTRGRPTFSRTNNARTATVTWEGLDVGQSGQVVWTTWKDWLQAGDRMEASLSGKLAGSREDLGRTLGSDLTGMSVATAAERVYAMVKYVPGGDERWEAAQPFQKATSAGEGSAIDRGTVLLALLRTAGFDARPAMFRPRTEIGSVPLSVPAPALMAHPAVAVYLPGRTVWIDPASERVAIPELPASMLGATVWVAGDAPFELPSPGVLDGDVAINVQTTMSADGSSLFTASVNAGGVGEEWLRTLLAPLSETDRQVTFQRLISVANPSIDRFAYDGSGIEDPYRPLQITLQGHLPAASKPYGTNGMIGDLHPLMAPALAAWLPSRILVHEEVSNVPPAGLAPIATTADEPKYNGDATVTRKFRREGAKITLISEAQRPYATSTAARDDAAESFLHSTASDGVHVIWLPPPTPDVVKSVRTAVSPSEGAVLESLLWWTNNGQPKKGAKAFKRAMTLTPAGDVGPLIDKFAVPDETRPWIALWEQARDDRERLQAIHGLASRGHTRDAWSYAVKLSESTPVPEVKVEALLLREDLQGPKPDPTRDAEATLLWKEPAELLAIADAAGKLIAATPDGDPRVLKRLAARAMDEEKFSDAEVLLERALKPGPDPEASVLLAEASADSGVTMGEVVERIDEAVLAAPFDADVISGAARATARVGRLDQALAYALAAARLRYDDPDRWFAVVPRALAYGDLGTALYAARRASDLRPTWKEAGASLALCATLARDSEGATLGGARSGVHLGAPGPSPTVDALLALTPDDALLALLQYHDAEVIASPQNLSLRAQLRLDAGMLDGAARDGALLAARHQNPRGVAIAFAATAGRLWSTSQLDALDAAARVDAVASATRMEWRLMSGTGDPQADAKTQKDDPRAQIILRAATSPDAVAAETPGSPAGLVDPVLKPPPSFKPNKILGGAKGVVAFSDPERATTILKVAKATGQLPPVLAQLYTPAAPAVRRIAGGGQVVRLDGGPIPLYAAIRIDGEGEITAVAYTPEAAVDALLRVAP